MSIGRSSSRPHIDDLRRVSATVVAAAAAVKIGIEQQARDTMWQREYRHVEAS